MLREIKRSEIELIHEKTLHLLEHVGVDFEHEEAIEVFKQHGARVEGWRVFMDRKLVEEALSTLKPSFVLRTPYEELKIGEGGQAFATASGSTRILRSGRLVQPTVQDYILARKLDATSPVINLSSSPLMYLTDIPEEDSYLIKGALTLKYSKHPVIMSCAGKKDSEETIALAKEFYDMDEGYCTIGVGNVISPLFYSRDGVDALLAYAGSGQPVCITCCSSPGLTSPITLGGTLIQNNAEVLAGIIMTQLVTPGLPVIYGNLSFTTNMRTAETVSWGPEAEVFLRYGKALADFYGLPFRGGGSLSSSKTLDYQNGAETALALQASMDAGTDMIFHLFGEMDGLNIFSFEKYVLDEELLMGMLSMRDRDLFAEDMLCMDSLAEVGPKGNFLLEEETLEYCHSEIFYPRLSNISSYTAWQMKGSPNVEELAKRAVEKRIAEYELPEFTPRQQKILERVLKGID